MTLLSMARNICLQLEICMCFVLRQTTSVKTRLLSNGRPVAWGALVESVGDQSFVLGARTGA